MTITAKKPVVIAHVTVNQPPDSVRTDAEWVVWREQENQRMAREAGEQAAAFFELQNGAIRH